MSNKTPIFAAGALITILVVGFFLISRNKAPSESNGTPLTENVPTAPAPKPMPPTPEPEQTEPAADETATPEPEAKPREPLPELDDSDAFIRRTLSDEFENERLKRALQAEQLVRKAATATDQLARGRNPFRHIFFLKPEGEFLVEKREDAIYISEKNYARFEPLVRSLESMGPERAAALHTYLEPLLHSAYLELGNQDMSWRQALKKTCEQVVAAPVPAKSPELVGSKGVYIFADPALEELTPLEKMMIRMGPSHAERVKRFAAELAQRL